MGSKESAESDSSRLWKAPAFHIVLGLLSIVLLAALYFTWRFGSPSPVLMIPIAALVGPFVGLFSDAPYFTSDIRLKLATALTVSATLIIGGWIYRKHIIARIAVIVGVVLWVVAGGLGFGPQ